MNLNIAHENKMIMVRQTIFFEEINKNEIRIAIGLSRHDINSAVGDCGKKMSVIKTKYKYESYLICQCLTGRRPPCPCTFWSRNVPDTSGAPLHLHQYPEYDITLISLSCVT